MKSYVLERVKHFVDELNAGKYTYDIDHPKTIYCSENREDEAISLKRTANYDEACEIYLDMLEETAKHNFMHAIPPFICRSFAKVLMAANEFYLAFQILMGLYSTLHRFDKDLVPDCQYVHDQAFIDLNLMVKAAKNPMVDELIALGKNYSGNKFYTQAKSSAEIASEAVKILVFLRK